MKQFRKTLYKLLNPHIFIVLSSIPLTVILLAYIFLGGHKNGLAAYASYLISAYSLIIVCVQIGRYINKRFMVLIYKNKHTYRYMCDLTFRSHISLSLSFAINIFYAALHFCTGIYYRSLWSGTLAVYYCFFAIMRFLLLRHVNRNTFEKNKSSEFKQYRRCGILLLLMNIVLSGVILLVMHQGKGFQYSGMLIYVMAIYAFYSIILAAVDVIKYRKHASPVLSASKAINLVAALVAMFSLETAMLSQFGNESDYLSQQITIGITGAIICTIVFGTAIFMLIYSSTKLKEMEENRQIQKN